MEQKREELDHALEVAVEHTKEAQGALIEEPAGSSRSVELATDVEQRAEDIDALASEVLVSTEAEAGPKGD